MLEDERQQGFGHPILELVVKGLCEISQGSCGKKAAKLSSTNWRTCQATPH